MIDIFTEFELENNNVHLISNELKEHLYNVELVFIPDKCCKRKKNFPIQQSDKTKTVAWLYYPNI